MVSLHISITNKQANIICKHELTGEKKNFFKWKNGRWRENLNENPLSRGQHILTSFSSTLYLRKFQLDASSVQAIEIRINSMNKNCILMIPFFSAVFQIVTFLFQIFFFGSFFNSA